jgi:integrase/recombinase XerD
MGLGKQAKVLSKPQQEAVLAFLERSRHRERNKVIFLLSARAGLRAKEIAALTWSMVTDATGQVSDAIALPNNASKGKSGGTVWLNDELKTALVELRRTLKSFHSSDFIVVSDRSKGVSAQVVVNMFWHWYRKLGFDGCSSHSGRRTFITNAARKISSVGGSMKDVQMLARHSSLSFGHYPIISLLEAREKRDEAKRMLSAGRDPSLEKKAGKGANYPQCR